jgi:VIT1/CCC1 family predicted Fe2+/Mn2+ transporter
MEASIMAMVASYVTCRGAVMTDTDPQKAGSTDGAQPSPPQTLAGRIRRSFLDSAGSIVFGMEDGTVSIFGLVFGVAAAAPGSSAVLLAGATGAISAAVSMMAGTFLDVETANDQAAQRIAEEHARYATDPDKARQDDHRRLISAGFSDAEAATVTAIMGKDPETRLKLAAAVDLGTGESSRQNPYVQSAWMLVTDLLAAAVPVVPFAIFGLGTARIVSLTVTFALLVILGIGRARVGRRRILPTIGQTVGIAMAAALAGLLVGRLIR